LQGNQFVYLLEIRFLLIFVVLITISGYPLGNKKKLSKPQQSNSEVSRGTRSPGWFYLVLILLPVVFLVLLEILLRIFNYGIDLPQWVQVDKTRQILNPEIAYKYFYTTKNIPQSNQNVFDVVKSPHSYRVFVFGESSAAGYPYIPNGSFSNYLQKRLELLYPQKKIEVVNVSISATNTFTMRDLMPGVIEQKPDLIIFYAGHNEYYGALGVGSMESIGSSRSIVNTVMWLNQFKTVELLRNSIKFILGLFSGDKAKPAGTLMSQMAKEQSITYQSDIFNSGLEQFEGNMRDMLEMTKEAGIPVLFGMLTSNLKDQEPFISVKSEGVPSAQEIFNSAKQELKKGNTLKAAELFRYAKDLDVLRFRAPEKINMIIKDLASEFNYNYVNIDSVFNKMSPDGIVGDNLMTDHLHPTLSGNRTIGRLYFEKIRDLKLLQSDQNKNIPDQLQDSLTIRNIPFSELDSVIGKFRIAFLRNDWPYVDKNSRKDPAHLFRLKTSVDSLAYQLVNGNISWEKAHKEMALRYLNRKQYSLFSREVFVMADQYPFVVEYHQFAADQLVGRKEYDLALPHLFAQDKQYPDAFTSKWIGNIKLSRNEVEEAIRYLNKSLNYNNSDAQVLYNLAGAYSMTRQYNKALEVVNRSLSINPNDPKARALKAQLSGGR